METDGSGAYISVDLTAAVLLSRFLDFWRRWLPWLLILCAVSLTLRWSTSAVGLIAIGMLFYLGVRYPVRRWLRIWTVLLIVAAPLAGVWSLMELSQILRRGFPPELAVPLVVVLLFFWICGRVLRKKEFTTDQVTILDGSVPFATEPSFSDVWLSGGWRSGLVLGAPWVIAVTVMEVKPLPSCLFLALAATSVLVIPWVFLPVLRSLRTELPIRLLRAIAENRARQARHGSYRLFVLRKSLNRPLALGWFTLSAISIASAVLCLRFALSQGVTELSSVGGLGAFALFGLSVFWLRLGRRHALQRTSESMTQGDERYSLYLRSFLDDNVKVLRDGLLYRVWLVDQLFNILRFLRFEEVLAETVWPFGRVVALDRPGDTLPQLGALRIKIGSGNWQEAIGTLVRQANNVLMNVGVTSGLKWEFQQFVGSEDSAKLSLVLLPNNPKEAARTWRAFASGSPQLLLCPEDLVVRSLTVRFLDRGRLPVFCSTQRRSVAAYKLALNTCWLPFDEFVQIVRETAGAFTATVPGRPR